MRSGHHRGVKRECIRSDSNQMNRRSRCALLIDPVAPREALHSRRGWLPGSTGTAPSVARESSGRYALGVTDEQLANQKELILRRISELEHSFEYLGEETKAIEPSVSLGRLTRMEAINDKGVNEHVLAQNRRSLEQLRNALDRVSEGTYGMCIRCGQEIPITRLELVPQALICVPCSERPTKKRTH